MRALVACALIACALGTVRAPVCAQSGAVRAIDAAHSNATFAIGHIFVNTVEGSVPIVSGTVTLAAGTLIPEAVTAVLDATRIRTDEPDRDAALESPDYFDTKQFPTWTFASTKITPTGPSTFGLDGLLTIHGVTQPEHLDVTVRGDLAHPVYHATGHIDRHAFAMRGARLDPVIGNSAAVTLEITLS
jgi:polyisoprenoid-binding protein YceI